MTLSCCFSFRNAAVRNSENCTKINQSLPPPTFCAATALLKPKLVGALSPVDHKGLKPKRRNQETSCMLNETIKPRRSCFSDSCFARDHLLVNKLFSDAGVSIIMAAKCGGTSVKIIGQFGYLPCENRYSHDEVASVK